MAKAPSIEAINALLDQRSFGPAFAMATHLTTALPSQAAGWFALGRAAFGLGRQATADHAIDRAMRLGADPSLWPRRVSGMATIAQPSMATPRTARKMNVPRAPAASPMTPPMVGDKVCATECPTAIDAIYRAATSPA